MTEHDLEQIRAILQNALAPVLADLTAHTLPQRLMRCTHTAMPIAIAVNSGSAIAKPTAFAAEDYRTWQKA